MPIQSFAPRPSAEPKKRHYLFALALVGAALALRAVLEFFTPGATYFIILLPAVVLAGIFCGTGPAVLAAVVGGAANAALFVGAALLVGPAFNTAQISALLFAAASTTVLWATHSLRRSAGLAADAEARLGEVLRQIPGAVAILEAPEGRLLLRSAQSEKVLGHVQGKLERSEDLVTYGALHDDGRAFEAADYPIVRALKAGEIVAGERFRYRQPTGPIVDLEVHAGPVRDRRGRIVAAVGMAFDVSERVKSERRLRQSEAEQRAMAQRLRAALDIGAIGLWELDLETGHSRLDETIAAMLGLPPEPIEMTRVDMQVFVDSGDQVPARDFWVGAIGAKGDFADEVRMRTAQGASRWLAVRGTVLADEQRVIGVIRDVTQRRTREDALQDALRARELLMREADHRIKNSLQLVVSLLTLQIGKTADPDARLSLGQAIAQVNTVAAVHLALQHTPDLRSIEVDQMLEDLCNRLGSLNPAVKLRYDIEAGMLLDAERALPLGLVVCEVVTNALRHAFPGGTPGEIVVTTRAQAQGLDVSVADNGIGLPASPRRAGLGTTVVDAMTKQIGARIGVESVAGAGTTVTLRLPSKS
jgi:PAS domain S-box-containing protein